MKFRPLLGVSCAAFLLLLFTSPVWSQESEQATTKKKSNNSWLRLRLSEQDLILTVSSIEWGTPDRWSFTSRYIHRLGKNRKDKEWFHSLCVTLSPGISGGRLAVGYQNLYDPQSSTDFGIFSEARIVILRTWGNPLSTSPNRTFMGGELRISLSFLFNLGIGYFTQISATSGSKEDFLSFHVGIGV